MSDEQYFFHFYIAFYFDYKIFMVLAPSLGSICFLAGLLKDILLFFYIFYREGLELGVITLDMFLHWAKAPGQNRLQVD